MMLMSHYHDRKSKPDFDDSCRSGATDLDLSTSDRSEFNGVDFRDARSIIWPKSCLAVKTQQESMIKLSTSAPEHTPRPPLRRSSTTTSSSISFDKIIVRNYDVILTDNPSTTTGPPIGLGWTHNDTDEIFDVDVYENCRTTRSKREFALPSAVRWEMLRSAGSSNEDLMKASQGVRKRQTQRQRSLRRNERLESLASGLRCIVSRRKGQQT